MRASVAEGTSALFLLTTGAAEDKMVEALKGIVFEPVSANLSKEEDRLRAVLAEEDWQFSLRFVFHDTGASSQRSSQDNGRRQRHA